jgi:putative glutamine amidotransferase
VPHPAGVPLSGVYSKTLHYLEESMAHWLMRGGAMAVMVPAEDSANMATHDALNFDHYAAALDGLLLQGGNDVAPQSYGEKPLHPDWHGDPVRDRYETQLIQAFMQAGKPVFGVCRGLQLLNVMLGGTLWQDIGTQRPDALQHRELGRYEQHWHDIDIVPGTHLARLYPGVQRRRANSIHHQGIKDLAPTLVVEARCPEDGLIEAVRYRGPGYVAAVQWHPEFHDNADPLLFDDTPMLMDFFAAARQAQIES